MEKATPDYFGKLLTPEESIQYKKFGTFEEQYDWVAEQIRKNIQEDKLKPEEILVVYLNQKSARWSNVGKPLQKKGIASGYISEKGHINIDTFRVPGKVTVTHIYRAKGNEAPMVYVLDADCCAVGSTEVRNKLFTAITRAKGWVRICGVGQGMDVIAEEINACRKNDYTLAFTMLSKDDLEKIKRINRDAQQDYAERKLDELIRKLDKIESFDEFIYELNKIKSIFSEEDEEILTALIDGRNLNAIKSFIRKFSSSKGRRRRG